MKLKVVPEPSERCTTTIAVDGRVSVGVERLDRRVVPGGDRAEDRCAASVLPSSTSSPGLTPSRLMIGTMPPITIGNCTRPFFSRSASDIGLSVAPKVTVLAIDLLDAAARTDRLVVEADAGVVLVGVGPLGEHRIDEGRAGAGKIGGQRGARDRRAQRDRGDAGENCVFHFLSHPVRAGHNPG